MAEKSIDCAACMAKMRYMEIKLICTAVAAPIVTAICLKLAGA